MDKSLNYLTLCQNLEEVYLEGNVCIEDYPKCKDILQNSLKKLRILDGKNIHRGEHFSYIQRFLLRKFYCS